MLRTLLSTGLLVLLGACAPRPPQNLSPPDLPPLGPCPATGWTPEAPPPTQSARVSMVLLAVQEWARFGRQTIDFRFAPPRVTVDGIKERDAPQRINNYWRSVGRPNLSGLDTEVPWSAAFISWDIASAGVPRDLFCPDARHTIYVERMVLRAGAPGAAFLPHRAGDYAPKVGDLVCASRLNGGTTLENLNRGPGHCDIVVEVRADSVHAIGGNVGDSVTRSVFPLDAKGFLSPISARPFFTVVENNLP
jgi:Uncharacterized protein conserved in bacteria (DUF2272)